MDFLNKAYGQLADVFKSMTPGARWAAGLLLTVAVVSVGYLFNDQIVGGDAYLMGGERFSASQLHSMHAALGKANLDATIDGARIKVPRGLESKCMAALAEAGALPVEFGGYLEKAVSNNSFLSLNRNQDAAMKIAKQRELQNIINTMVEKSLVLIDEQSDHGFPPKTIITASVSIQPHDQQPLDENRIPAAIRYLVASSVAGLKPEAVTVVDLGSQRTYPGTGGGDPRSPGTAGEYAQLKRYYEREYQEKISQLLAPYIPGVLVTTSVELDPETSRPPAPTAVESSGTKATPPGEAKLRLPAPSAGGARSGHHEDVAQTPPPMPLPSTPNHAAVAGRAPKRVTVSVAVPNSYYEKIWQQANPPLPGAQAGRPDAAALTAIQTAENKKIAALVSPLLPRQDPDDSSTQVAVSTFYQFSAAAPRDATLADGAVAWLGQHTEALGLLGLATIVLVVLRTMIRSALVHSRTPAGKSLETPESLAYEQHAGEPSEDEPQPRRRAHAAPSLRDELADVVRDDPQAAVTILRTWIGNTG